MAAHEHELLSIAERFAESWKDENNPEHSVVVKHTFLDVQEGASALAEVGEGKILQCSRLALY